MDISLTGATVFGLFVGIILLLIAIIYGLRAYLNRKSASNLAEEEGANLASRAKYSAVNPFRWSGSLLGFGVAIALAASLLAFSWTSYEEHADYDIGLLELDDEIIQEPPRTAEPPPPPPPPPPPVIEEVPEEEIEEEEEIEFEDQEIDEETVIEEQPVVEDAPPPPPPPPPPAPVEEEIFKVVEQMPRFPGCENVGGTDKEKEDCAKKKMLAYIYKNLKYPMIAKENGIEGQAVLQFVVNKDGSVGEVNIVRDPGAGTGEAAQKVVKDMNNLPQKWTPGKQRGRPVKVLYTLPVRFKLEG